MANSAQDELCINTIRFLAVDAVQKANSGHPGMPLGAAAAAYTLWSRHLAHDAADPKWFNRDRFVLSAGHASAPALRAAPPLQLRLDDRRSQVVSPVRQQDAGSSRIPPQHAGVEVTTGPLGQGFANAVGLAMAQAQIAATYANGGSLFDHFTYVMAGDGDMMEGISGEAASIAGHLQLGKLICLYDDNKISLAAPTSVTFTEDVGKRFEAYGWHAVHIDEAHANDVEAIDTPQSSRRRRKRPSPRSSSFTRRSVSARRKPARSVPTASRSASDNVTKTKEALGWPVEPAFLVPDEATTLVRFEQCSGRCQGTRRLERGLRRLEARERRSRQTARARDRRYVLPADLPWPTFNGRKRQRCLARCGRRRDERDRQGACPNSWAVRRISIPQRRRISKASAISSRARTTAVTSTTAFANTRWPRRRTASRPTAACCRSARRSSTSSTTGKPALRLAALNKLRLHLRVHARLGVLGRRRPDASADRATRDACAQRPT